MPDTGPSLPPNIAILVTGSNQNAMVCEQERMPHMSPTIPSRSVYLGKRRTSMRLEPEMWDNLADIARREGITREELVRQVDRSRGPSPLSRAIRVFCAAYYRTRLEAREKRGRSRRSPGSATPRTTGQP